MRSGIETTPEALPKLTIRPRGLRQSSAGLEGGLADAVIDDVDALAAGQLLDLGRELAGLVVDDVGAAVLFGLGDLLADRRPCR